MQVYMKDAEYVYTVGTSVYKRDAKYLYQGDVSHGQSFLLDRILIFPTDLMCNKTGSKQAVSSPKQ